MSFAGKVWRLLVGIKDALALLFLPLFFWALFMLLASRPSPGLVREGALLLKLDGVVVEEPSEIDPFALLLVPMLGFAAIAVDIGALYAERARLQVAADAAAIAVAQDCSRGNCGDMLATAQALITANDGEGSASRPVLSGDPLSVTVTGSAPQEHWFAPVIGHEYSPR